MASNWDRVQNGGKGSGRRAGADDEKYAEGYARIFGTWPCEECGNKQIRGHAETCSKHVKKT